MNASITYGFAEARILANNAGIIDSGTTYIALATGAYLECSDRSLSNQCSIDAYNAYEAATGAQMDRANNHP